MPNGLVVAQECCRSGRILTAHVGKTSGHALMSILWPQSLRASVAITPPAWRDGGCYLLDCANRSNQVTLRIRECVATDLFRESQTENTKLPPNIAVMAPCCYDGVLPNRRPCLKRDRPTPGLPKTIPPGDAKIVPPLDHTVGHRTKQLSHFAEMTENEKVA